MRISTSPQKIESAQLHAPASISTGPQAWHDHLKIVTLNVRGLYKETKITSGVKPPRWLDHLLQDYAWWYSSLYTRVTQGLQGVGLQPENLADRLL
eukprot:16592-Pelagomonas_calceolata.AAC.1